MLSLALFIALMGLFSIMITSLGEERAIDYMHLVLFFYFVCVTFCIFLFLLMSWTGYGL